MDIALPKPAPINVLALRNEREHRVVLLAAVLQTRNPDVHYGEDKVGSTEVLLAREERIELDLAIWASHRGWRDDGNEEHRFRGRRLDLLRPQRAGSDRFLVLPKPKLFVDRPSCPRSSRWMRSRSAESVPL